MRKLRESQLAEAVECRAKDDLKACHIGGALFGDAGAVGGAMSGKNKQSIIFYVTYKDGHSETKTVEIDSDEYKKYMIYLEQ